MLTRLLAVVLLLLQPLPAQGLEALLPCAQSCPHCDGAGEAAPESDAPDCCGAPSTPADCPCVHEAPPEEPVESAAAPRLPEMAGAFRPAASYVEPAFAPAWRASRTAPRDRDPPGCAVALRVMRE